MLHTETVIAILWEWKEGTPHAGSRFWGCHGTTSDGRIKDWPKIGLRALGAAKVTVVEGDGLDLLRPAIECRGKSAEFVLEYRARKVEAEKARGDG